MHLPNHGDRLEDLADAARPLRVLLRGACYEVCPVKINIPEVLIHLRNKVVEQNTAGLTGAFAFATGASLEAFPPTPSKPSPKVDTSTPSPAIAAPEIPTSAASTPRRSQVQQS